MMVASRHHFTISRAKPQARILKPSWARFGNNLFQTRGENGLEMRLLLFAGDNAYFDSREARLLKPLMQLHFAEAEPVISVEFSRLFEAMTEQVEHHEATAPFQNPVSGGDCAFRTDRVMQCLTQ